MKRMIGRAVFAMAVGGGAWLGLSGARAGAEAPLPPAGLSIFPTNDGVFQGYTLPQTEYKLSFPTMGVVHEVRVKEGDVVKAGDVLMVQDDREEQAELKVLQFDADSRKPIDAAKAEWDLAKVKLEWSLKLQAAGGQNDREVAENQAQEKIAGIKYEQAVQEREQYKLKRDKQQTHIDRMTLKAPKDGVVFALRNDVGSNVDPTKESIVIVQNNPLKVEVAIPARTSLSMKPGDTLRVSYDRADWKGAKDAKISFLSPKADAGSGMRLIQLELPNPEGAPAGLQAFVDLREKVAAADQR